MSFLHAASFDNGLAGLAKAMRNHRLFPALGDNPAIITLRENIACFMYFRRVNHTANTSSLVSILMLCCLRRFTST